MKQSIKRAGAALAACVVFCCTKTALARGGEVQWFIPLGQVHTLGERYLGTTNATGVSADADGNVYVCGWQSHYPGFVAGFVEAYTSDGSKMWRLDDDEPFIVMRTAGDASTYAATSRYVRKLRRDGSIEWTLYPEGTLVDLQIAPDGDIVVLGSQDEGTVVPFVRKYAAADSSLVWEHRTTSAHSMTIDAAGQVFFIGVPSGGASFIEKLSVAGVLLSHNELSASATASLIAADRSGNLFLAGQTRQRLFAANRGDWDVWLAQIEESGTALRGVQAGTAAADSIDALAIDGAGNIYVGISDTSNHLIKVSRSARGWAMATGSLSLHGIATSGTEHLYVVAAPFASATVPRAGTFFDSVIVRLKPE